MQRHWKLLLIAGAFAFALSFAVALLNASQGPPLDDSLRQDFIAGFQGDKVALDRAVKAAEELLSKNPKHAEAKLWHGVANFYLSGQAYQAGDMTTGAELWDRSLKEMDEAVAWEPENPALRRMRGGALLGASRHEMMPPEMARPLIETAVGDYEKILALGKDGFNKQDTLSRGEVLAGLADGWDRLGNHEKARLYYERIVKELTGSQYEQRAKKWLENRKPAESK